EAAISGRVDFLRGLKENVIMGRLIPAGTGMKRYRNVEVAYDNTARRKDEPEPDEFTALTGDGLNLDAQATTSIVMDDASGVMPDGMNIVEDMDDFAMSEVDVDEIGAGMDDSDDNF
ncbi:MAG: hypothetical protein ABI954_07710, partial [Pyrinomonadaceae bacterium]